MRHAERGPMWRRVEGGQVSGPVSLVYQPFGMVLSQVIVPCGAVVTAHVDVALTASCDLRPKQIELKATMDRSESAGVVEIAVHILGEDHDAVDVCGLQAIAP